MCEVTIHAATATYRTDRIGRQKHNVTYNWLHLFTIKSHTLLLHGIYGKWEFILISFCEMILNVFADGVSF